MNKMNIYNNKTIFITGGTGSFGQSLVKKILDNSNPKKIIIYSRDEFKQYKMQIKIKELYPSAFNKNLIRFFIGDVRDYQRLNLAITEDVNILIHAAALKQVPICEYNPFEAVKTNVLGAQNVIDACIKKKIDKVIALSTDKASSPVNLYGATKLTSDKLFIAANNFKGKNKVTFSVVRYGNVMGSRGSVIPLVLKNLKYKKFNLTHKKMTRFNITLKESVDFVTNCLQEMKGSEIFIPKLPSYNVTDLIKSISKDIKIKITGIRPGEKLHEEMISTSESLNALEFKKFYIILPAYIFENKKNLNKYLNYNKNKGKHINNFFSYNSLDNSNYLKINEIKKIFKENYDTFYLE